MDCSHAPLEFLPQQPLNTTTYLVIQYLEIGGIVLSKQQVKMLSVFRQDVFARLTFRQLKERNGLTSNNAVQLAVKEFRALGIVRTATVGDVTTYALNLENGLALAYLNLANEQVVAASALPKTLLAALHERVLKRTTHCTIIVFGSHAKGTATAASDVDVAVIVEDATARRAVAAALETVKRRELSRIDAHVFTAREYLELLRADGENLGKQVHKSGIVTYGYIEYLALLRVNDRAR